MHSDIDLVIFGIDGKGAFEDLEKALIRHEICDRDNIKCIHNAMVSFYNTIVMFFLVYF